MEDLEAGLHTADNGKDEKKGKDEQDGGMHAPMQQTNVYVCMENDTPREHREEDVPIS